MKASNKLLGVLLATATALVAAPAAAVVQVSRVSPVSSSILIDSYGDAGFGQVEAFYFVPPLGALSGDGVQGATGLSLTLPIPISGNGTNQVLIDYELTNPADALGPTTALKFFAKVDPTGDDLSFNDIGAAILGPTGAGEPDAWSMEDVFTNTIGTQVNTGQLNNMNSCGSAACDIVGALQWNIGVLQPGETARVRLSLSDNGQRISETFLTATRADVGGSVVLPEQVLTISGVVAIVPEPGAYTMLLAGLGLLVLLRMRRD